MPRYRVNISEGVSEIVDADTEDEAKKKVKAIIATGATSPFYDKLYFDYDTGIQDNRLRAGLSVAEDYLTEDGEFISEKENYLKQEVGSDGFIRDSKGSIALTPIGQARLGLEPSNKNIVILKNISDNKLYDNQNVVKVITKESLEISEFPEALDFVRETLNVSENIYHHLGIYCYQLETLKKFVSYDQSHNEIKNKLEQLRALDNNIKINVALAKSSPIGVDTQEDFVAIKKIMEYKS